MLERYRSYATAPVMPLRCGHAQPHSRRKAQGTLVGTMCRAVQRPTMYCRVVQKSFRQDVCCRSVDKRPSGVCPLWVYWGVGWSNIHFHRVHLHVPQALHQGMLHTCRCLWQAQGQQRCDHQQRKAHKSPHLGQRGGGTPLHLHARKSRLAFAGSSLQ